MLLVQQKFYIRVSKSKGIILNWILKRLMINWDFSIEVLKARSFGEDSKVDL